MTSDEIAFLLLMAIGVILLVWLMILVPITVAWFFPLVVSYA